MTRSIHALATSALVVLAAGAAAATPTATLTLTSAQYGTNTTVVKSHGAVAITASYQVTALNPGQTVHLEFDICDPGYQVNLLSGGFYNPLPSCVDGEGGNNALRVMSGPLAAGGSNTGITGTFVFDAWNAPGLSQNGAPWIIPGRIVLDGIGGATLASTELDLTISAAPNYGVYKQAVSTHLNGDGTSDVVWLISLGNDLLGDGAEPILGTTTITDPVDDGATYISGIQVAQSDPAPELPRWAAIDPDSNVSITDPATNPSVVTINIDNVITGDNTFPTTQFQLTYRYPATDTLATNVATAHYPNGSQQSASWTTVLGPDTTGLVASLAKYHYCPGQSALGYTGSAFEAVTANLPNPLDNLECAWAPEAYLQYEVQVQSNHADDLYTPVPMGGGDVIDTLPPQVVLTSIDSAAGWSIFTSTDTSCTASSSWTPATGGAFTNPSGARCIRFTEGSNQGTGFYIFRYSVQLNSAERSNLESNQGAYEFVTNNVTFTGGVLSVNGGAGGTASTSLISTFWNAHTPEASLTSDHALGLGIFGIVTTPVGSEVEFSGAMPFNNSTDGNVYAINEFLGFHGLSFSGTLPPQLDLTGSPALVAGYDPSGSGNPVNYVDGSGRPVHLNCTYSSQDRTTYPVTPASFRCQVIDQDGNPAYTPSIVPGVDPTTWCAPPYYCTDAIYDQVNANYLSETIWNEMNVAFPTQLVSGTPGEFVDVNLNVWSNEGNTSASGLAFPGASESNPAVATTYIYVSGTPQLEVQTAATTNNVVVGTTETFNIDYSNTGNITTAGTTVYDIFGYDSTTGLPLAGYQNLNCTPAIPQFAGVQHISGTPPSTIEYTTGDPTTIAGATGGIAAGVAALGWSTTPPTDLTTVTGVRFVLNSEFSSNPGDYSPVDQAGVEQVMLVAPNAVGERLCSMASVVANGLNIAGAIDLSAAVQIIASVCTVDCNPNAVPGNPQTVAATPDSCGATVTLDATGSTQATHFDWYEGSNLLASSDAPVFTATAALSGLGQHFITLIASDALGISASATVLVTVIDQTAPVVTCSASPGTVTLNSDCSASQPNVTATAADNCSGAVAAECGIYQAGETSITCTATDSSGNTGSCSVPVTVTGSSLPPAPSLTAGDVYGDTNVPVGPNGGFCDDSFNSYIYFTWVPGCTTVDSPTATLSYVLGGVTQQLTVNYLQTYDDGSGTGTQIGYVAFPYPANPDGTPIDFHGPLTLTITGSNGGSSTLVLPNSGFEPCTCTNMSDFGQQMVLFEDLWPNNGDLDFNDETIVHDFSFQEDANNNILAMKAQINVVAIGATIHNGLYLHLPGIPASAIANVTRYFSDGTQDQPNIMPNEPDMVIEVVNDTRSLYAAGATGFINTDYGPVDPNGSGVTASTPSRTVSVVVTFASALSQYDPGDGSVFLDTSIVPFDLFIAQSTRYSHQIHLPGFPGTQAMDLSLFDTGDDNSNVDGSLTFVNKDNLPFALAIPQIITWPQETIDIGLLYPELPPYAASGGTDSNDDYWYGDGSLNPAYGVSLSGAPYGYSPDNAGPVFVQGYCPDDG